MTNQRKNLGPKLRYRTSGQFSTRVFGIGFHKTGTSSLARVLYILGYNVAGYISDQENKLTEEQIIEVMLSDMDNFDAAQDTPWFIFYQMLDEKFPDSKFILTTRDENKWIKSVVKHFGNKTIKMHELIYGTGIAKGNEQIYLAKYRQHHAEVLNYFADRPNDLLVIDMIEKNKWEKVTTFLGYSDGPNLEFPHANRNIVRDKTFLEKVAWSTFWKLAPIRRLILGKNHNSEPWIIRPNLYEYFNDVELLWPKLESKFKAKTQLISLHEKETILNQLLDTANHNRQLVHLMKNNQNIDFNRLDIELTGPLTLQSVKEYWNKCAIEFRYFISGFNDEDFLFYHAELNQRSYQAFQSVFSKRFFEDFDL